MKSYVVNRARLTGLAFTSYVCDKCGKKIHDGEMFRNWEPNRLRCDLNACKPKDSELVIDPNEKEVAEAIEWMTDKCRSSCGIQEMGVSVWEFTSKIGVVTERWAKDPDYDLGFDEDSDEDMLDRLSNWLCCIEQAETKEEILGALAECPL